MVTYNKQNETLTITVENASVNDILEFQNSLILALSTLGQRDITYPNEIFNISRLLENIQPARNVLEKGFNNTPLTDYMKYENNLTENQKTELQILSKKFACENLEHKKVNICAV